MHNSSTKRTTASRLIVTSGIWWICFAVAETGEPVVKLAPLPQQARPTLVRPAPPVVAVPVVNHVPPQKTSPTVPSRGTQADRPLEQADPVNPTPRVARAATRSPRIASADPKPTVRSLPPPQRTTSLPPAIAAPVERAAAPPLFTAPPQPTTLSAQPITAAPRRSATAPLEDLRRTTSSGASVTAVRMAHQQYVYAMSLSDRGAFASAREELTRCLSILAQDSDRQTESSRHSHALAAALTALHESNDFGDLVGPRLQRPNLSRFAAIHKTPILSQRQAQEFSAMEALQAYLQYAEDALVDSVGHPNQSGSEASQLAAELFYALAKVTQAAAKVAATDAKLADAKAITLYRSALRVQPRHLHAANELAVLLGTFGALEEARDILAQAATQESPKQIWHNLAKLHQQLGENDMADQARRRYDETPQRAAVQVNWVSPAAFASPSDVQQPVAANGEPSASLSKVASFEAPTDETEASAERSRGPKLTWLRKLFERK